MKCPIKLSPAVAEFIKKNDLVYIGVGSQSDVLVKGGKIVCESLRVMPDGLAGNGCNMTNHFGGLEDNHYFIRRPDATKHFPNCLPKTRETRKDRYFRRKTLDAWTNGVVLHQIRADGRNFEIFKDRTVRDYADKRIQNEKGLIEFCLAASWEEITLAEANAYLDSFNKPTVPVKTEVETLREENASLKARIAELESEKEKLRAAIKALNNF